MNTFIYPLLKRKLPDLNERELLTPDFEAIRRREKIAVISRDYPRPFKSCFIPRKNGGLIILHKDLRGIAREFFAWYELGRYFLHAPRPIDAYRLWQRPEKDIFEAEALPLLAMMPYESLSQIICGYQERTGFVAEIIKKRIYLFTYFGV